jgi:hypothetical protein
MRHGWSMHRLELTLTDGAGNARLVERSLKLRR